ncbi:major type 1 subunit fimbrin (pilin) [Silvimonas terrae]|uniref:Major type 1 subunit fimbrin (Pilin) n=1 Tax=Silvimonas terrae TaxID=300266 RepID=A0A840RGR3_9NEIS|nr:fimbrial protein [Silvimonas terrae]MBB5191774.1 major type 1 subunit fimbrin (pilin) [Silvimonas terrae]
MKKHHLLSIVMAAVVGAVAAPAAMASDGTITINGELTAATCAVVVGGDGGQNGTVTLPKVSTAALPNADDVAGLTWFKLSLSGDGCTSASAKAGFESSATTNAAGRVIAAGTGAGVDFELVNADQSAIKVGTASTIQGGAIDSASKTGEITYGARYHRNTDALKAGPVSGSVTYTMIYN